MNSPLNFKRPVEVQMNCMEVCGGHVDGSRHLRRPGLEVWIRSQSNRDTEAGGGELHLVSSCASGRITRMLIADVCGIGPLFRDIATRFAEVMKRNVNFVQQTRSVQQLSEQLADASQRGGFASTLMSTYFAPSRTLTVCNAGHPPPIVYRAKARQWSLIKHSPSQSSSKPLAAGVLSPAEYSQTKTNLESADMFLAYSNSLTECRAADGRMLGVAGLMERLNALNPADPGAIPDALLESIQNEHPDNLRDEDATIYLSQVTETRVAWKDNVLAPFRLLRSVSDRTSFA